MSSLAFQVNTIFDTVPYNLSLLHVYQWHSIACRQFAATSFIVLFISCMKEYVFVTTASYIVV